MVSFETGVDDANFEAVTRTWAAGLVSSSERIRRYSALLSGVLYLPRRTSRRRPSDA
jgi:hypothetical protein